jgi:hypothetical protein
MICSNCGQDVNDGVKYCTKCGKKCNAKLTNKKCFLTYLSLILSVVGIICFWIFHYNRYNLFAGAFRSLAWYFSSSWFTVPMRYGVEYGMARGIGYINFDDILCQIIFPSIIYAGFILSLISLYLRKSKLALICGLLPFVHLVITTMILPTLGILNLLSNYR